jgi:hypothetical protein
VLAQLQGKAPRDNDLRVFFGSARHIVNLRQPWKGGPDIAGPVASVWQAIDKKTLAEAFRAELDRGMALADYAVAKSLYDQAVGGNVTAAIWWTKARMGWSENKLGVKIDVSIGE